VQGEYGAVFAIRVQNFIEHYVCRGTNLIGATSLSPVTKLEEGTGAVSRYKLSRSRKIVKVQDFDCVQLRESGFNGHYEFVMGAEAKAKTVTSLLIIPSVLAVRGIFLSEYKRSIMVNKSKLYSINQQAGSF
jgi:hypothetical protein